MRDRAYPERRLPAAPCASESLFARSSKSEVAGDSAVYRHVVPCSNAEGHEARSYPHRAIGSSRRDPIVGLWVRAWPRSVAEELTGQIIDADPNTVIIRCADGMTVAVQREACRPLPKPRDGQAPHA